MQTRIRELLLVLGAGLAAGSAGLPAEAQQAAARLAAKSSSDEARPAIARNCTRKTAPGAGPTRHHARLKAWELIAQRSGNWPIPTDALRNERYSCRQTGIGWHCTATIDVCKPR